jgi:hypothetical protein
MIETVGQRCCRPIAVIRLSLGPVVIQPVASRLATGRARALNRLTP